MASAVNRRRRRASSSAAAMADPPACALLSPLPPSILPSSSHLGASPALADSSIAQIKLALSSRLDSLSKESELAHCSLLKEVGAASARLSKRVKLELQSCMQHMDEFERDCNAFSADYDEDMDEIKGDYEEFTSRAQNSLSQYIKKTLPEFMKSVENRHGEAASSICAACLNLHNAAD